MDEAKRKIHKFNFKKNGSHVAIVDKACNLQEVLTMKAQEDEVQVTLSMKNFLKKFFDLWEEDAAILAGILGYSSEAWQDGKKEDGTYMSDEEFINSKIESVRLLKGANVTDTVPASVALKVEELLKQFGDKLNTSGISHDVILDDNKGDPKLDKTEIATEELLVLKAAADEVLVLKGQMEALKASVEAKAKTEMEDLVKGYSFITEDKQEGFVDYLLKSEGSAVVLEVLEKARDAIAASILDEDGTEGEDLGIESKETSLEKSVSLVADILKKRKA